MNYKGKKVVIMGLGLHGGGVGVAKFFCRKGSNVLVTDLRTKKELKKSVEKLSNFPIKHVLGEHKEKDFLKADLIIKNPGVPKESSFLKRAREKNIPIETDMNIFFQLVKKNKIIGITGTKGKSTVSALISDLLKNKYSNIITAGNMGISPLNFSIKKDTIIILELSSFALEDLKSSPNVAVVTNIYKDHLNRYKSFQEYIEAKKRIFKFQNGKDILVLNKKNKISKDFSKEAKSKVIFFSGKNENISAAVEVAKIFKISEKDIKKTISNFKGIPGRQEFVGEINGVKYINDTTATMPEAVISALKNLKSRIILIAGGEDKNINYKELSQNIIKKVSVLIIFPGTASKKIKEELKTEKIKMINVFSMKEAVNKANQLSEKGDIVILSPGAASFNMFKNEFDRGNQFKKEVINIKNENQRKK